MPATTQITIGFYEQPDEILDSCQSCAAIVKEKLNTQPAIEVQEKKRGPGRPVKDSDANKK